MSEVHVLGIRHHGPGSARSVAEALDELRPDLVLIEGAPELDELTDLAGDPDMVPPVAALVYASESPRLSSFYPVASFSPEWVAMRWAARNGSQQRFLDLPAVNALAIAQGIAEERERRLAEATAPGADQPEEVDEAADAPANGAEAGADERARRAPSDPITALAAAAGYDDPERWWEDAVEQRTDSVLDRFAAIRESIAELRADETDPDSPILDGGALHIDALSDPVGEAMTAVREAAMRKVLRQAIKDGHQRIVVVCGAWHAPALDPATFPPVAKDNRLLKGLPKVKAAAAWVPWTASRLSYESGYGAGVSSPGWYRHLFDHWAAGFDHDVAMSWLIRVARALRQQGIDASTASVVEATRLASTLASLRGRPSAGLSELDDSALSILADGNPIPLRLVHDDLVVGRELGAVPERAPLVPLAADLAAAQRATRLKPTAAVQTVTLDLRTPGGLARSILLHRLVLLGIGWGSPTYAGRTTGTFKESWQLEWVPELAVAVVEASLFGTTVASAASAKAAELAREATSLRDLSELISRCLTAELPVHDVVQTLADRSAVNTDVAGLLGAVEPLAQVTRYGTVRGVDTTEVNTVLRAIVARGCVGLPMAGVGIDEESAAALVKAVDAAHAGLTLIEDDALLGQWYSALGVVAARDQVPGRLAGRATRMLLDAERVDRDEVGRRMGTWLSPVLDPVDSAGWLDGFLAGSAIILIHDPGLLALVDGWVAGVATEAFEDLLPLLRRTFTQFAKPERKMIGEQVSTGAREDDVRGDWDLAAAAPGIGAVARMLGWEAA
ncbi:hypothetical protein BW730_17255 [Tessaracoccus aquimaris]|uniref:Uncharacterized protein n=1 Tax=Tessaracoccus aquimaris TaxID=1332264 RepID=A0A1Q2CS99_9ACTN|nr:DUF5682 family protein [Tessaracoccus aquimaris]AQP48982.1 hypothetical protein BW730_17255 [Tessaracoccus aquimaris]